MVINMMLIVISALFVGTLVYAGGNSFKIIRNFVIGLLSSKENPTLLYEIIIYGVTFLYLIIQTIFVYWLNSLLKKTNRKLKLGISLIIAFVLGIIGISLISPQALQNFFSIVFISTSLLFIVFGLFSYLISQQKITGVNIITSIAVFAITIATCALFIILSVFSGLEKMNIEMLSNVNPDLKITPAKGKVLPNINEITTKLDSNKNIEAYTKVIEEKVSIEFEDKEDISYIKGIDKNYTKVVRIDTSVVHGAYLDFKTPYQLLASDGVARRLQMYIDHQHASRLRIPKPGTGLISTEEEAFNTVVANPIGVLFINEQYDKYIFSPIGLTQTLLQLPPEAAYSIELKLKPNQSPNVLKENLRSDLGNGVVVQTRQDLDATFLKVMNVENLIIYLIFTLVIIIASFNLAGAIIIIIIDKKAQIKSMWSFGIPIKQIKQIFFNTGILITSFSILFGLILGSTIGLMQIKFHLVMANPFVAFPFEFKLTNYLIVLGTVLFIGGGVSYLVSRRLSI